MASVKVAVRVRPFNKRELENQSDGIIKMFENKTVISNPKMVTTVQGQVADIQKHEFSFDHSYWSHNVKDVNFASQKQVFEDLGSEVVDNAFEGYNACVFAYGQTGSGKTYTMMGTPDSVGLIPRICQELFSKMTANKDKGTTYRTEVSYLEIYNERVKDLLKKQQSHSLKIREHPKIGPYVQDLSKHLVMDFRDIQELMSKGNANRTTASTNMNDVSSRSHAIFTICFTQAKFSHEMPSETVSKVNLVDLAGSERADASGATGQRLKEGAHINKSLVTLGSVISALADYSSQSAVRQKTVFIPYRDSVLTWLLKDSLGGNSKTIMIATISPADINYGETLSTLRYANRAKNIINKPTINEDPNVRLIRELRAEISKLRALLNVNSSSSDMMEKLHENEAKVKLLTDQWAERWKETHKLLKEKKLDLRKSMSAAGIVLDSQHPHLVGIEDDLLATGITLYHLNDGDTLVGTEDAPMQQDIVLSGVDIEDEHCVIELKNGVATLIPLNQSQCKVNFVAIDKPTRLSQGCVIHLGKTNMLRYNDPAEVAELRKEKERGSLMNLSRLSLLDLSRSANDLVTSKSLDSLSPPSSALTESPAELEESVKTVQDGPGAVKSSSSSDLITESNSQNGSSTNVSDRKILDLKSQELQFLEVGKRLDGNLSRLQKEMNVDVENMLFDDDEQKFTKARINELVEQEVRRRLLEQNSIVEKSQDDAESDDIGRITPESQSEELNDEFSIAIPSYIQRGSGRNFHFEYEIVICTVDANWRIYRRYRRFREVFIHANRKFGKEVKLPEFPPRYFFFPNSERKVEQRRIKLQQYLQELIAICSDIEGSELVTRNGITKDSLCKFSNFFQKGIFEIGKYGTG